MFCSAIIPTVGRSTLSRAVESALQQELHGAEFEVIVINDSGAPLPEENWQKSHKVRMINTNRRERSVARNTGVAASKGKFLHFLDDDDWLVPGAYQHFFKLSQETDAKWLYGMTQLIDRNLKPTIQLRHNLHGNCFLQAMAGEWIPLQASMIEKSTFMNVGGFNPLLSGPEDIDLLRRVLLENDVDETPHIVAYVIRGEEGSTTDYSHHSQASRSAREWILDSTGAFQRMRSSATDPFWYGRLTRVYLTSILWNFNHGHFFRVLSRLLFSTAGVITAGSGVFSKYFWQAVSKPYASITFEEGLQVAREANIIDF